MKIDSHQHFWNPARGDYDWMPKGDPVLDLVYRPADLTATLARHQIDGTVLVQAAATVAETEYMLGLADASDLACLAYQRPLMNPYCIFDLCVDLVFAKAIQAAALSRSHAAGPASTSLVSDAETCLTRKTLRPLKRPVVAPVLAELALVAMTIAAVLGTDAILFQLTILAGLAALSRGTKISLVTSSASFCSSEYNSGGC